MCRKIFHPIKFFHSRRARERGASSLEFVGTFAVILFAAFAAIQFSIAGWAVMEVTDAARDGARVEASHGNGESLITHRLAHHHPTSINCFSTEKEATCMIKATVPSILPRASFGTFTRTATMPSLK